MRLSANRFPDYREIVARRAEPASCSHPVKVGDRIGWNARVKRSQCAECWRRWVAENAAADCDEAQDAR